MQKVPAWYTLIGFSLFHQLIDQHCHVGQPPRVSKNMGKLPLFPLTDSGEGKHFSFLFFFTTEISYLIIGLWHLLEPVPLWRENSLCAAQLKPLQFVNLPLPVPGPPGESLMCNEWLRFLAALRTDHRVRESNPTQPCSASTKTRNECSHGISQRLFDMLTHRCCFELCQGAELVQ